MPRSPENRLAFPLPPGCCLVGPAEWCADLPAGSAPVRAWSGLEEVIAAPGADPRGAAAAGRDDGCGWLLLLHAEHLGAATRTDRLAEQLQRLLVARPGCLPVLLYDRLPTEACAALFRAGLFDALPLPLAEADWRRLGHRLDRRRRLAGESRLVMAQSQETSRLLHAHRRQLHVQVARVGEELIEVQRRLEEANRRLTEHMEQLSLLYRFGRDLGAAGNWDATLERILERLVRYLGAAGAALVLRAAPEGPYAPRRTYRWEQEEGWTRVLSHLQGLEREVAGRLLVPGAVDLPGRRGRSIVALPLDHQEVRLGFLLLLAAGPQEAERLRGQLPFLRAVQVILGEEVARAQMLDRLREIGLFNTRVLETVQSWLWVVDESGRTLYCNRAARRALGGGEHEPALDPTDLPFAVGRGRARGGAGPHGERAPGGGRWPELLRDGLLALPDRTGGTGSALLRELQRDGFRGEARIDGPDGEAIPVLLQTTTMAGRGADERWLVVVAEDLREAKQLASERLRADRLESLVEMSATLAHEIRNPLMGLSAQAELLAEHLPEGDRRRRYLDVITGEVERINGTITRLLGFIRPYEPELARFSLLAAARDCLDLVAPRLAGAAGRVRLVTVPEGEAPAADAWTAVGDGAQLKQVLLNLLLNALDASPPAAPVELRLDRREGIELAGRGAGSRRRVPGFQVEVVDRGPGFADGDAERIFRPFYTTKSAGTGLGLAICRKIVAAHGGEIRAEREGALTIFRVLLPARPEPENEPAAREAVE